MVKIDNAEANVVYEYGLGQRLVLHLYGVEFSGQVVMGEGNFNAGLDDTGRINFILLYVIFFTDVESISDDFTCAIDGILDSARMSEHQSDKVCHLWQRQPVQLYHY